jgi:hypothetical protein
MLQCVFRISVYRHLQRLLVYSRTSLGQPRKPENKTQYADFSENIYFKKKVNSRLLNLNFLIPLM